jgi:hypothetical protein
MERNIRSLASFLQSLPDWTEFNECFAPSKIKISDLDGIVERNGHFLVLDMKNPRSTLGQGQRILYQALARKGFMVLIVYAEPAYAIPNERLRSGSEAMLADLGPMHVCKVQRITAAREVPDPIPATTDDLKRLIREWYLWADKQRGS